MTNIITACFGGTRFTNTRPAWLIDHGMVLQIKGVELPDVYEVDFSNSKAETATRVLGNADGVVIPDQYFLSKAPQIYAWVYLTTGDSGFTTLQITIPLSQRPDVSTEPPTPQETDLIEQAIAALNDGVERAETAADDAEAAVANVQQTVNDALQAAKDSGEFDGRDGVDGTDGVNGVTFTPDVDAVGNISWTNDGGLPNPQTRNIKGPKGDKLTYADLTAADKADLVQGPIADAQTAAVNTVNQAGTTQVQAVANKGAEVLQSIPSDYTELTEDVDDLKSATNTLNDAVFTVDSTIEQPVKDLTKVGASSGTTNITLSAIIPAGETYTVEISLSAPLSAAQVMYWRNDSGNLNYLGSIPANATSFTVESAPTADANRIRINKSSSSVTYTVNIFREITETVNNINKNASDIEQLNSEVSNISNKTIETFCSLAMFEKIGIIGDSYAMGSMYIPNGSGGATYVGTYNNLSWGKNIERLYGINVSFFAHGGLSTRTWLTSAYGMTALENAAQTSPCNLYWFGLGINDVGIYKADNTYLGSIADISGHESGTAWATTFYGNVGQIIERIQAASQYSKIVISSFVGYRAKNPYPQDTVLNNALAEIAEYYGLPFIDLRTDDFYVSDYYADNILGKHPVAMLYSGMAMANARLFGKAVFENQAYFKDYHMGTPAPEPEPDDPV